MALASPSASIEGTHLFNRPISENSLAVDVFFRHESPHPAIVGLIPVVTQNKVMAWFDVLRRIRAVIEIFGQDVILFERLVVDVDDTAFNLHDVTGHAHNPLDV